MTKQQMIIEWVRASIRNRLLRPGDKLPSEKELTEKFNVSRGSVRLSLQALVNEGLLESRQGVGTFVRQQLHGDSGLVAFVCYRNSSYIFPEMIHGFNTALQRSDRRLVLGETRYDLDIERRVTKDLVENGVSGIVITPVEDDAGRNNLELFRSIEERGIPVVFLDNDLGTDEFDAVVQDNVLGGKLAARILIDRGHRRIGVVYSKNYHPKLERLEGMEEVFGDSGIPVDERYIIGIEGQSSARKAYLQIRNFVYGFTETPSAFVCSSDDEALMLIRNLKRMGLRIPDDVSVVSFDNSDISRYSRPPLTTMDHPSGEMGEIAGKVVVDRLENRPFKARTRIVIEPKLITRRSVSVLLNSV